jgi:hypothetical protein
MSLPNNTTIPPSPAEVLARAEAERQRLLEAERQAHRDEPRNFKEDALHDKVVSVEPDGTGPTSTQTFDTERDRQAGSGSKPA